VAAEVLAGVANVDGDGRYIELDHFLLTYLGFMMVTFGEREDLLEKCYFLGCVGAVRKLREYLADHYDSVYLRKKADQ
jgi:hypothetical protein